MNLVDLDVAWSRVRIGSPIVELAYRLHKVTVVHSFSSVLFSFVGVVSFSLSIKWTNTVHLYNVNAESLYVIIIVFIIILKPRCV